VTRETVDALREFALSLPDAWEDFPWEHSVAKVGKKVFVFLPGPDDPLEVANATVKLPESGGAALSSDACHPAGYGMGRSGWVSIDLLSPAVPPLGVLQDWIEESYRAIAPKRLVKLLDTEPV
jgi:predicted DNA-binding protein (MmcQ/YjbR family)